MRSPGLGSGWSTRPEAAVVADGAARTPASAVPEAGANPTAAGGTARQRVGLAVVLAGAVGAIDQLTKWWALENLEGGPIDLLGSLRFNLAYNKGTAFSLGGDRLGPLIAVVAMVVAALLLRSVRHLPSRVGAIAAGLVLGGAIGNVADRAFRSEGAWFDGAVVDFIDLQWWPIFNIADAAIVVGAVLYVLVSCKA
ncbi:hypothetical protein BH24ACT3_BH24ACT3_08640 [soil metagenome]